MMALPARRRTQGAAEKGSTDQLLSSATSYQGDRIEREEQAMAVRDTATPGAPCWTDLWTSDVGGARRFYGELFGWGSEEPDEQFGGYFSFTRNGERVAGCMGDMGDMKANNTWKPYLATDDIAKTIEAAEAQGAQIVVPGMAVADLGVQGVMTDPGGSTIGIWQPKTFQGFAVLGEHGAPSWFELHARNHARAVAFYRSVFSWDTTDTTAVADADEFRYTTFRSSAGGDDVGGVMDARNFRAEGTPDEWSVYWEVDDCAAATAKVQNLGGSVIMGLDDTPYGVLAVVSDPFGAQFKLRTSPK
jgi:predicted enzyme related to lactoylglutathione lyase